MAPKATDSGSSLLRSNFSGDGRPPQGPDITTSSFEDGPPDDDCEPRRRLALFHMNEYFLAREVSHEQADNEVLYRGESALESSDKSESARRYMTRLNVTLDLLQSELTMLGGALDSMTRNAHKKAFRHDLGFLATALVSVFGTGILFLRRSHIIDLLYVACAAAGLNGLYRTLYWWASSHCDQEVKAVQDHLEKGTLREFHSRYLEGGAWSFLRNANL